MKRLASIAALLLGVGSAGTASAGARPVPAQQWDTGTQLTLAQVMVGEADWHEPDHIAIAYVLTRRWQHYQRAKGPITFQRYMQLYSSTMKVDTERARWVRGLPWGKLEGPHEERWAKVMELVKAWGAGKVEDPCPVAEHWGGGMDRPGRSWMPVSCGMTKNIFYGPRDKGLASGRANRAKQASKAKESADRAEAPREKHSKSRAKKPAAKASEARAPAAKKRPQHTTQKIARKEAPRPKSVPHAAKAEEKARSLPARREAPESAQRRSRIAMARPGDW